MHNLVKQINKIKYKELHHHARFLFTKNFFQKNSLLGGNTSFSATNEAPPPSVESALELTGKGGIDGVKQEGHPFKTRGPHVSPIAVSCTTQVHRRIVVLARNIHTFIIFDLALSDLLLLPPPSQAPFTPIKRKAFKKSPNFAQCGQNLQRRKTRKNQSFSTGGAAGYQKRRPKSRLRNDSQLI
jgi:hypothetical protein